jgi:hypothetical protein
MVIITGTERSQGKLMVGADCNMRHATRFANTSMHVLFAIVNTQIELNL